MRILGTGSFLPAREVSNEEIARTLDTTDEWIYSHTGIRSRHVAADDETTSTMAVRASRAALEMAATNPGEIGLVVCATSSPDYNTFPSTACLLQGELGCEHAGAYDLQAACAGFIYALEMARGFVALHPDQKVPGDSRGGWKGCAFHHAIWRRPRPAAERNPEYESQGP